MTSPQSDAAPPAAATTNPEVLGKGGACPPTRVPQPCPPRCPYSRSPSVSLCYGQNEARAPSSVARTRPGTLFRDAGHWDLWAALPGASELEHFHPSPFLCL